MLKALYLLLLAFGQTECIQPVSVQVIDAERVDISGSLMVALVNENTADSSPPACHQFVQMNNAWHQLTGQQKTVWYRFIMPQTQMALSDTVLRLPMPGSPDVCVHWPTSSGRQTECMNQALIEGNREQTWFRLPENLDRSQPIDFTIRNSQHLPYGFLIESYDSMQRAQRAVHTSAAAGFGFMVSISILFLMASYSRRKMFLYHLSAFCLCSAVALIGITPGGLAAFGFQGVWINAAIPLAALMLMQLFYGNFLVSYMYYKTASRVSLRRSMYVRAGILTALTALVLYSPNLAARWMPWILIAQVVTQTWMLVTEAVRGKKVAGFFISASALMLMGIFIWAVSALIGSTEHSVLGMIIILSGWILLILSLVFEFGEQVRSLSKQRASYSRALVAEHGLSVLRSSYCQITGLPLRHKLAELFQNLVDGCDSDQHRVGIYLIQIDRLIEIRRRYGRQIQLQVMAELSSRFRHGLEGKQITGRVENLEFLIVIPTANDPDQYRRRLTEAARNIVLAIEEPVSIDNEVIELKASMGVSIWPSHGTRFEQLLSSCDSALYEVVKSGGGKFKIFDDRIDAWRSEQLSRVDELQHAIESGQLNLYYQPIVDGKTGAVYGAEALVRWDHPEKGLLYPDDFLNIAKSSELIVDIGFWSLSAVVADMKWFDEQELGPFPVSINFTPDQFAHKGLINQLCYYLENTDIDPRRLRVEITEDSLIENLESARHTISRLRNAGVAVYIDDFGVGYSSLNYLRSLPIYGLKIDQSFVSNIGHASQDEEVIKAVIRLAKSLDLFLVAEGVETSRQKNFLLEHEVNGLQGFYYSRAIDRQSFVNYISQHKFSVATIHQLDLSGS